MNYQTHWFQSSSINPGHNYPTTQIYCWILTKDNKIAIVSKDNIKWQFPGGKPKSGEADIKALGRELKEEISLSLNIFESKPVFLGYYVINELDGNNKSVKKYLHLRYFALCKDKSINYPVYPSEKKSEIEENKIKFAKWVSIYEAKKLIPWLAKSEELTSFLIKYQQSGSLPH